MHRLTLIAAAVLTAAPMACRAHAPRVPVVGPAHEVAALSGHWSGEYDSPLTGRSGTIDLTVTDQGDSASGVVVMIPAGFAQPVEPWRDPAFEAGPRSAAIPALLTIRLIWVEGNRVTGLLAPTRTPARGTGSSPPSRGGWRATRSPAPSSRTRARRRAVRPDAGSSFASGPPTDEIGHR